MPEIGRVGGTNPWQKLKIDRDQTTPKQLKKADLSSDYASGGSVNMASLIKEAKEAPEVRQQLVDEIKKAITQGIYKIDPERVARHLLRKI
ncbi:MAG: flagellar biosynthesis anti-sigma factor FlgM [Thermotogae bacterium]|nr:MAG: flagellar biosynthesis anti-sigma factor FlgM [Thermotogota bacterium]